MDERVDNRITRTSGMNMWRAGCSGSCTSGSEGGPERPTSRKADRALRSDPYTYVATWAGFAYAAFVTDVFSRRILGWRTLGHRLPRAWTDPNYIDPARLGRAA